MVSRVTSRWTRTPRSSPPPRPPRAIPVTRPRPVTCSPKTYLSWTRPPRMCPPRMWLTTAVARPTRRAPKPVIRTPPAVRTPRTTRDETESSQREAPLAVYGDAAYGAGVLLEKLEAAAALLAAAVNLARFGVLGLTRVAGPAWAVAPS